MMTFFIAIFVACEPIKGLLPNTKNCQIVQDFSAVYEDKKECEKRSALKYGVYIDCVTIEIKDRKK